LYDTKEEENSLKVIRRYFGNNIKIINPKEYDKNPTYSKQKRIEGMEFCYKLVSKADCIVFQCFTISPSLRKFVLDYLTHADEYKGGLNSRAKKETIKLRNLIHYDKIMTPGVYKEVSYALNHNKPVYEVIGKKLKQITQKPHYAVLPKNSYKTFSMLLNSYLSKSIQRLFPPFWWLG
jgi:hypothetical protein